MSFDEETLTGTVEEVTYRNDTNSYTVIDIACEDELITAVGIMPDVNAGETVTLTGTYTTHPSYGRQFKATALSRCMCPINQRLYSVCTLIFSKY